VTRLPNPLWIVVQLRETDGAYPEEYAGRLVDKRLTEQGSAPSYFLEGLLYNVPNERFGGSYNATFVSAINWILQAERKNLVCANEQHYQVRDSLARAGRAVTAIVFSMCSQNSGTSGHSMACPLRF
jgi:hypothetical protein